MMKNSDCQTALESSVEATSTTIVAKDTAKNNLIEQSFDKKIKEKQEVPDDVLEEFARLQKKNDIPDREVGKQPETTMETAQWLLSLGLSPIPNNPEKASKYVSEDGSTISPKAPFHDKYPVKWKQYQDKRPLDWQIKTWFQNTTNGIGALGGVGSNGYCYAWIDFDLKDISSEERDIKVKGWLTIFPEIETAPRFRTPSGGYRFLVAWKNLPEGWKANNGFHLGDVHHCGELLTKEKSHTLLPPSKIGENSYYWEFWCENPPVLESPESIGLHLIPSKTAKKGKQGKSSQANGEHHETATNDSGKELAKFLRDKVYPKITLDQAFNWEGHNFKHDGEKLKGYCPWHESTSGTAFYCERKSDGGLVFNCPVDGGGDVIDYRMKLEGKKFIQVVHDLCDIAGVDTSEIPKKTSRESSKDWNYLVNDRSIEENILLNTFKYNDSNPSKNEWMTLNSSFHKYNEASGSWERKEDEKVLNIICHDLRKHWRMLKDGTIKKDFFKDSNKKSAMGICRDALVNTYDIKNDHLIAFKNGTYNIYSKTLEAHSKNNYLTWSVSTDYAPQEDCPEAFKTFVYNAFGIEYLELIQAIISFYLDPSAPYGYFVHLVGESGSGKGTFLRFLQSMFQESNVSSIGHFSELQTPEKKHQLLSGVRLNVCPDSKAFQGNMTVFYELVDNGWSAGRALYASHSYNKQWNVRFLIASTKLLAIEDAGDGWNRRCISLPTLPRRGEIDHTLGSKLEAVRGEVISWALSIDPEKRNRLIKTACNFEPIMQLKRQQELFADPIKAFIDSCLTPDENATPLTSNELFEMFTAYSGYAGHKKKSITSFVKDFEVVMKSHKTGGKHFWDKESKKTKKSKVEWLGISFGQVFTRYQGVEGSSGFILNSSKLNNGGLEEFENPYPITLSSDSLPYEKKDKVMTESPPQQESQKNLTSLPYELTKVQKVEKTTPHTSSCSSGCSEGKKEEEKIPINKVLVGDKVMEVRNPSNLCPVCLTSSSGHEVMDEVRQGNEVMENQPNNSDLPTSTDSEPQKRIKKDLSEDIDVTLFGFVDESKDQKEIDALPIPTDSELLKHPKVWVKKTQHSNWELGLVKNVEINPTGSVGGYLIYVDADKATKTIISKSLLRIF